MDGLLFFGTNDDAVGTHAEAVDEELALADGAVTFEVWGSGFEARDDNESRLGDPGQQLRAAAQAQPLGVMAASSAGPARTP